MKKYFARFLLLICIFSLCLGSIGVTEATGADVAAPNRSSDYIDSYAASSNTGAKREVVILSLIHILLEAELFGYEKGAFTGANASGKRGLIEIADGGTLFLDEINSMPLALQGKLLRVLETQQVKRIGALKGKNIDFRIIAATNADLTTCIQDGAFRVDLYYRLNVMPLTIPPLRERTGDIRCV